ncbi:MAG TPA: DsbC family protein [Burkholderiales bacterium]|nr:DsbC family protein [Burkholderiales bacterium]
MLRFWIAAVALLLAGGAQADEASVKKALEGRLSLGVESVTRTPVPGIYEVFTGGEIVYVDESGNYLFYDGSLIDLKSKANLTSDRLHKLTAIRFDSLPLDLAFKKVKGNGSRRLAYFADPNCGFCKRFEQELNSVTDVTVYMFLYPILTPDSIDKSKAVWCSDNRAKAWDDWMQRGVKPAAAQTCDTPVEKVLAYGKKMSISGTPTLVFADGSRVPGAISGEQLRKLLDAPPAK